MGIPKPPFYDELKPYPFKLIYAYLMIPYAFVGFTAQALWINGMGAPMPTDTASPFGVILHVIYFYVSPRKAENDVSPRFPVPGKLKTTGAGSCRGQL